MEYVRLGQSGLKISKIILGCMSYGDPEWNGKWVWGEEEASKQIKAAYVYSSGISEEILGRAIKEHQLPRDKIVVMTKVFFPLNRNVGENMLFGTAADDSNGYVNQYGLSRKHIFDSVKHSLRRLQLEYIDLLQCHRFDPNTPIEETMQALHDVVKAGYVRYIGMSSCHAWQFHAMQSTSSIHCRQVLCSRDIADYAINNKLTPFISMQNYYNLLYREEEREMFSTLKHFGVGSIPWSPLARGALTRPLENQNTKPGESDAARRRQEGRIPSILTRPPCQLICLPDRVEEIAKKRGISMAQVSVAWALNKEGVSAPIVGTTSLANLADAIAGARIKLTEEEIDFLEEPYQPRAILGHW
ncbi:Aldo keto reductase [Mycena polygramma]|nr:Aldo keto reductase [Mycena polygramma]